MTTSNVLNDDKSNSDFGFEITKKNEEHRAFETLSDMSKLYKTNKNYILRQIANEFILVPTGNDAEQMNGMLLVNSTFVFLWEQFQKPHTIRDIVLVARQQYNDTSGDLEKDICSFVAESLKYGFLEEV